MAMGNDTILLLGVLRRVAAESSESSLRSFKLDFLGERARTGCYLQTEVSAWTRPLWRPILDWINTYVPVACDSETRSMDQQFKLLRHDFRSPSQLNAFRSSAPIHTKRISSLVNSSRFKTTLWSLRPALRLRLAWFSSRPVSSPQQLWYDSDTRPIQGFWLLIFWIFVRTMQQQVSGQALLLSYACTHSISWKLNFK